MSEFSLLKAYGTLRRFEQEAADAAVRLGRQLLETGVSMDADDRGAFEREIEKGAAALTPFVQRWNLPLNPEQLDEIAYAVLRNAFREEGRSENIFDEIDRAVNVQLDEFVERWAATPERRDP